MLYRITDGTVSLGGTSILSHIHFEVKATEKIAVVGANGAGKTTLLRLLAGELSLDRDDKRQGEGIFCSRRLTVGYLQQQVFADLNRTAEEEMLAACPCADAFDRERFDYEREYDRLFLGFGFAREDKKRSLASFSGGEQTKIAFIRLLLEKPDLLLLDEPTNHLDMETVEWLERYLKTYPSAVVMVSHDRFFLDRTAQIVYELEDGHLERYVGNYSAYRKEKYKRSQLQRKAYEQQQEEIRRLEALIEKFKHKPTKAAFARSKKKMLSRMPKLSPPHSEALHFFAGEMRPEILGSKWVLEAEHAKIGYDAALPLLELTLRIRRGQKIALIGANGAGKSTFLKTAAGILPLLSGSCSLGNQIVVGYFDQFSAQISSKQSVLEHFGERFPSLSEKESRGILGAYLFGGEAAGKSIAKLSGGERARLVLAELLQSRPNFLILDEPTNHMDVQAKETLEAAFRSYTGTMLFVSHDRYFVSQVADAVLLFEEGRVSYYPFGYEHYVERREKMQKGESLAAQIQAEEQALLAGIRAVPKAEVHRLREISSEEAYQDWLLRPAVEQLEICKSRVEELEALLCEQEEEEWKCFALGQEELAVKERGERLRKAYEESLRAWEKACLNWGEAAGFWD
ncbi:MAG: ABC-F family ATP-binding cassette domain-containing protein [bacterium]|nr:ABC-F family ATP-binding cassette domain-containing protein [bacterium]